MLSLFRKRRARKIIARNAARRVATASTTGPAAKSRTKSVQHWRWVSTNDLKLGMYVAELSVPWEETGFMFQGFSVDSTRLLKQVQDVSEYALVRTQKVAYISSTSTSRYNSTERAAV